MLKSPVTRFDSSRMSIYPSKTDPIIYCEHESHGPILLIIIMLMCIRCHDVIIRSMFQTTSHTYLPVILLGT